MEHPTVGPQVNARNIYNTLSLIWNTSRRQKTYIQLVVVDDSTIPGHCLAATDSTVVKVSFYITFSKYS